MQTIFEELISIRSNATFYFIKYNRECDSALIFGENEVGNYIPHSKESWRIKIPFIY